MLSAARLPQVRAEACISLQASWERSKVLDCPNHVRRTKSSVKKRIIVRRTVRSMLGDCPNHVRRTKSSVKKRIIVRRTVRSMLGEETLAQLRRGCPDQQQREESGAESFGADVVERTHVAGDSKMRYTSKYNYIKAINNSDNPWC